MTGAEVIQFRRENTNAHGLGEKQLQLESYLSFRKLILDGNLPCALNFLHRSTRCNMIRHDAQDRLLEALEELEQFRMELTRDV